MAMIGKVRRLRYRQKKSVREIARMTSLSRNTVRKWLRTAPVAAEARVSSALPQQPRLSACSGLPDGLSNTTRLTWRAWPASPGTARSTSLAEPW